jgi:hypothetical protein
MHDFICLMKSDSTKFLITSQYSTFNLTTDLFNKYFKNIDFEDNDTLEEFESSLFGYIENWSIKTEKVITNKKAKKALKKIEKTMSKIL